MNEENINNSWDKASEGKERPESCNQEHSRNRKEIMDDWQMWQDLLHAQTASDLRDFKDTDYRFNKPKMR